MGTNTDIIMVVGVGNIPLEDEGIGARVVEKLQRQYAISETAQVVDRGAPRLRLMTSIEETDPLIVVDAVLGGGGQALRVDSEKRFCPQVSEQNCPPAAATLWRN